MNTATTSATKEGRSRLGASERADQILDVAESLILDLGALPIPMKRVGEATGASRGLVYVYFPDPDALARAVLGRQVERLMGAGLGNLAPGEGLSAEFQAASAVYVRHVARYGPIVSIILRDLGSGAAQGGDLLRVLARLARLARSELRLTPHEAVVFLELIAAIPEEAGRLVFKGELSLEEALGLCARLVQSGIDAVVPAAAKA